MIRLINATKYYPTPVGPHYVFRDVTLTLPRTDNVGVIGPNGAGKSTLLRLLAGADIPSSGRIERTGRISWPMGLTAGLQRTLTGRENARFLCRIYGMPPDQIKSQLDKIRDISQIGKFFDLAVDTYSAGMLQRVSFAISISLGFDYYIFDEISAGGDLAFGGLAQGLMRDKLRSSRFILASHNLGEVEKLCKSVIYINNGEFTFFSDVHEGIAAYTADARNIRPGAAQVDPAKLAKLRAQYIALKQSEKRQEADITANRAANRLDDLQRRLGNTRRLLLDIATQIRVQNADVPSDAEVARATAGPVMVNADPRAVQRLLQLRQRLESLQAAEARQELNAAKAETRAKRNDFLARLEATRKQISETTAEVDGLENTLVPPAKTQAPPLSPPPTIDVSERT